MFRILFALFLVSSGCEDPCRSDLTVGTYTVVVDVVDTQGQSVSDAVVLNDGEVCSGGQPGSFICSDAGEIVGPITVEWDGREHPVPDYSYEPADDDNQCHESGVASVTVTVS